MEILLVLSLATLSLAACSTTNSNNVSPDQVSAQSSEQQVCFYTQKVGWHFKQKTCMSTKAYNNLYAVSFMPSPPRKPIYIDQLPNSDK